MSDDASGTRTPAPDSPAPEPQDRLVTTHHALQTTDGELRYTARTGRIVIREEEVAEETFKGWTPRAEMAVTAYTLDDADVTSRPITFVFNGGPGSSSIWLHMGLLGPKRVDFGEPDHLTPPPYGLLDNPQTLLRASDLVFIDPMSTGHTRAVEGGKPGQYHGWKKDVEQVSELIRLWTTREDRWMSPKFLCGESYGTTRAVSVAEHLQSRYSLTLNGLILISSVLDFGTQDFEHLRIDEASINFLPTYAAIAHHYGFHPDRTLDEVREEAEEFAATRYRWALARGTRLSPEERTEVAETLARLTGLSRDWVERADLRIEHWRFCTELLRSRGLAVGRIDARITGALYSGIAENMDADPSIDALVGPYAAALHHYLRSDLGWDLDLPYEVFASAITKWSYAEFEGKPINVTDKLERVLRANPHLQVRVEYGYYDLATPYHSAQDMMAHLRLAAGDADRFEHAYFETGHMPYVGEASRVAEAEGITGFVRRAAVLG